VANRRVLSLLWTSLYGVRNALLLDMLVLLDTLVLLSTLAVVQVASRPAARAMRAAGETGVKLGGTSVKVSDRTLKLGRHREGRAQPPRQGRRSWRNCPSHGAAEQGACMPRYVHKKRCHVGC
jgi:hypothetical protein